MSSTTQTNPRSARITTQEWWQLSRCDNCLCQPEAPPGRCDRGQAEGSELRGKVIRNVLEDLAAVQDHRQRVVDAASGLCSGVFGDGAAAVQVQRAERA